jgi:hypothetical protein
MGINTTAFASNGVRARVASYSGDRPLEIDILRKAPNTDDRFRLWADPGDLALVALAIMADEDVRDALTDDQWERLSRVVREHDVALMAEAHEAGCPECREALDEMTTEDDEALR